MKTNKPKRPLLVRVAAAWNDLVMILAVLLGARFLWHLIHP